MVLPEFFKQRALSDVPIRMMNAPCRYDLILGRDVLTRLGLIIDFEDLQMIWDGKTVPMRVPPDYTPAPGQPSPLGMQLLFEAEDEILFDNDEIHFVSDTPMPQDDCSHSEPTDTFANPNLSLSSNQYKAVDINDWVDTNCKHLDSTKRKQLADILIQYPSLWDNKLGTYPDSKVHLELTDDAIPHSSRGYPVPFAHRKLFKEELDRLVSIGVLEPCTRSEWCAGTFIVGKASGGCRWVTDFRGLNKYLKRRAYPIPKIQDMLQGIQGYEWLSKLDVSMQFYTFELDEESKELTTFATPFGLFRYTRCPMGVTVAPDLAQEAMDLITLDLENVMTYFDDSLIHSWDWSKHLQTLDVVLSRLASKGFTLNIDKCKFGIKETDFLGFWLTPTGPRPWNKKVQAIDNMKNPRNLKQLKSFLGLVGFYGRLFQGKAAILAPLFDLTGKKFTWDPKHQKAFDDMKALARRDCLLRWPTHDAPFEIDTDSSDYQLGGVIKQNGFPIAYYSRKLSPAQKNYTTIEKECLGIVETLKEYRTLLLGNEIVINCDHKNLTHNLTKFNTQRVLRWRILIDEFGATFKHKAGEENVIADALSRVPTSTSTTKTSIDLSSFIFSPHKDATISPSDDDTATTAAETYFDYDSDSDSLSPYDFPSDPLIPSYTSYDPLPANPLHDAHPVTTRSATRGYMPQRPLAKGDDFKAIDIDQLRKLSTTWTAESLLVNPDFDEAGRDPTNMNTVRYYQQRDDAVKQLPVNKPDEFSVMNLNGTDVICKYESENDFLIVLTTEMLEPLVRWYHSVTVHATGAQTLLHTMKRLYYHPKLSATIHAVTSSCKTCKITKKASRQYGLLSPRHAVTAPWNEVHIDTIGPWHFKAAIGTIPKTYTFYALTCIDPVTNLVELKRHDLNVSLPDDGDGPPAQPKAPTAALSWKAFSEQWLCRYPKPNVVLHDNGTEFTGRDFQNKAAANKLKTKTTSSYNPQGNSICERMHLTVAQVLRVLLDSSPRPSNQIEANNLIDRALAITMHAMRCTASSALNNQTPGSIAFGRDMLVNIPYIADFLALRNTRQLQINKRLIRANAGRIPCDFQVNQLIMARNNSASSKLDPVWLGPFPITRVHTNGTVTFARPHGVLERRNIRQIKPA